MEAVKKKEKTGFLSPLIPFFSGICKVVFFYWIWIWNVEIQHSRHKFENNYDKCINRISENICNSNGEIKTRWNSLYHKLMVLWVSPFWMFICENCLWILVGLKRVNILKPGFKYFLKNLKPCRCFLKNNLKINYRTKLGFVNSSKTQTRCLL